MFVSVVMLLLFFVKLIVMLIVNKSGRLLKIVLLVLVIILILNMFGWLSCSRMLVIGNIVIGSISVWFRFCIFRNGFLFI